MLELLGYCCAIDFGIQIIGGIAAIALKSEKFYDLFGSMTFLSLAVISFAFGSMFARNSHPQNDFQQLEWHVQWKTDWADCLRHHLGPATWRIPLSSCAQRSEYFRSLMMPCFYSTAFKLDPIVVLPAQRRVRRCSWCFG